MSRRSRRITPVDRQKVHGPKPLALDYMQLTADAITLLRYVKAIEHELLGAAPDSTTLREIEHSLAKCGEASSAMLAARQNALGRYTATGVPKAT